MNIGAFMQSLILPLIKAMPALCAAGLALASAALEAQNAPTPRLDFFTTDGPVHAMHEENGTLYVGGSFNTAGPNTGGAVPVNLADTKLASAFPRVNGIVFVILPDGAGGWFLGGAFDRVGDQPRRSLARIKPDLTVDAAWKAQVDGGDSVAVRAMVLEQGTLFVGGDFTKIGGAARSSLASVNAATGAVLDWNVPVTGTVFTMASAGGWLHLGGAITSIAGQSRTNLGAVDVASRKAAPWDPAASDPVRAMAIYGDRVYVGGGFTNLAGVQRFAIGALDRITGQLAPWLPQMINPFDFSRSAAAVKALAVSPDGGVIFAGGTFSYFGARGSRNGLAALSSTNAQLTSWNPFGTTAIPVEIHAMALAGSNLFVSGVFTNLGRGTNSHLVALDKTTGLAAPGWFASALPAPPSILALATQGGTLYAGGAFTSFGGERRNNAAAFDAATGRLKPWNPSIDGRVLAVTRIGDAVYLGGEFRSVNRVSRSNLAAVDAESGGLLNSNIASPSGIRVMAARGSTLYVGGGFRSFGGQPRNYVAAIETIGGTVSGWNPALLGSPGAYVSGIAIRDNTVYLAGNFTNAGGLGRNHLAAIDAFTSKAAAWNPDADGPVSALALEGNTIYVGGFFSKIGVQARAGAAALQLASGKLTPWRPEIEGAVEAIAASSNTIFAGGTFALVGGAAQNALAGLSPDAGALLAWNPKVSGLNPPSILSLLVRNGQLFVGGEFVRIGGEAIQGLAALRLGSGLPDSPPLLADPRAGAGGRFAFNIVPVSSGLRIEVSEDLTSWAPAEGAIRSDGVYSEELRGGRSRFFRAVRP